MKIQRISIRNVRGARRVELCPTRPITLIAGFNGAAKTSVQECVRMAFSGSPLRVSLKRDYASLVTEGAKTGSASVETDVGIATYTLPVGSQTLDGEFCLGMPDALPYVLNAQGFGKLTHDERRSFLFSLTDCSVSEERLREMLSEAGCDPLHVEEVLPLLKSIEGFPAAAKFAADNAVEAKGAWRALTGETYGSRKAESWEASSIKIDPALIDATADECRRLDQELETRSRFASERLLHMFANAANLSVSLFDLADSPVVKSGANVLREPLGIYVERYGEPGVLPYFDPAENAVAISALSIQSGEAHERLGVLKADSAKANAAAERTAKAMEHHKDVLAWNAIASELGPDGIPAQLLAHALKPINGALRESAQATGWRQPTINVDMTITAEGRAYTLLCESEQWRVDAMIASALSDLSGIGILVLDRVDVLDNAARTELLAWLAYRADLGLINNALLFATLKQPPSGLPASIETAWLHDGEIVGEATLAALFPIKEEQALVN